MDKFCDYRLVCTMTAHSGAASRTTRHNIVRDHIYDTVAKDAHLPARTDPNGLVSDTHGRSNHDSPSDVLVDSALVCHTPGADKTAFCIDITVVTTDTATVASAGLSAATRAEDKKIREWVVRVAKVNSSLQVEERAAWTPSLEFPAFGVGAYGVLG